MTENESEFEQSYESDDSQYNFIPGYETEAEVTTMNEQRAVSPRELDPYVLKSRHKSKQTKPSS